MKTAYARVIGIDVAADKFDVIDSHSKSTRTMPNTVAAITRQLVEKIDSDAVAMIKNMISYLKTQQKEIEQQLAKLLSERARPAQSRRDC